jgi:hypothetical protein
MLVMTSKTKRALHQQSIYLEAEKAQLLDELATTSRIPKAVLLREAVEDLLSLNHRGAISPRVREVRNAIKKARPQLMAYRREIEQRKLGVIPLRNCQEAIDAIDRAREEFGD